MLKKRDLIDVPVLFDLMKDPEVFPYVRDKAETMDEYYFLTKQALEKEDNNELISRTILTEFEEPIGLISIYDMKDDAGFLNTWIGKPFFGKGYSKFSKEQFFDEVFHETNIQTIYLKIRKTNIRSRKSTEKLRYAILGNVNYNDVYAEINKSEEIFDLFVVEKETYLATKTFENHLDENQSEEIVG